MASARLLSKNIILSRKLNSISEGAENLYYRLLVMSDDFGCYHADPAIIKGTAYTLKNISLSSIEKRLIELDEINLINMYKVNGESYIQIKKFEEYQRFRSDIKRKSEYPTFEQRSRNESVRNRTDSNVESSSVSNNRNRSNNKSNNENEDVEGVILSPVEDVMFTWNQFAIKYGLAEIKGIKNGSERDRHLKARMNEDGFDFNVLLNAIERSPFLLGQSKSSKGSFTCTFDWIINATNYQKIIEGNYFDRKNQAKFSGIKEWAAENINNE